MAKKAQKGKPAKPVRLTGGKALKPVKAAKKAAAKPAKPTRPSGGKATLKKVAKPVKPARPSAGKVVAKPAKKIASKPTRPSGGKAASKPVKSARPSGSGGKVSAKKVIKPARPSAGKVASKPVKKAVVAKKAVKPVKSTRPSAGKATKSVAKVISAKQVKVTKPVAKTSPAKQVKVTKPVAKTVSKPLAKSVVVVKKEEVRKPIVVAKPVVTPSSKKSESRKKYDLDLDDDGSRVSDEPLVVEYKTPSIQRPMGPIPTPHINTDKRTRYSDSELKEFRLLILKKLEEAQKDYDLLKSTLSHKDDHGTDDTSPTFKLLEDGSDVLSKEETAHLASRQEKFIQSLQNALVRIENKTYGICRATGKLISKERLRSVPHATLAIEAKLEQNV